ncbi:hypothetical protein GCM10023322_12250 [Rugosimonospora acidiphila]|uniref:Uncharacterized protein n=1 Tax=Rugosimonospora acidiphila TaxID=556531 RepID=A0ABP9RLJ7_9ACTN
MTSSTRLSRFGDWAPVEPLCQTGMLTGQRPFYAGQQYEDRMALVRRAISEIRTGWREYPLFMRDLRELLEREAHRHAGDDATAEVSARLLSSVKEWSDRGRAPAPEDYSAIELYTSEAGYRRIFGVINSAFRSDHLVEDRQALRAAAFLVELLTIDLFNYRETHPEADRFEGIVYRGMCVTGEELADFREAAAGPITERYLSIPLGMVSASLDRDNATRFALEQARRYPDRHPLLWRIRVVGLDAGLLDVYRTRFPDSVVTSLCAVPIHGLSRYQEEREVLLRGPAFQLLWLSREPDGQLERGMHVIDVMMLNTNRDHGSAIATNEGADRRARDLFRTLVAIRRASICAGLADQSGHRADALAYRSSLNANRERLDGYLR